MRVLLVSDPLGYADGGVRGAATYFLEILSHLVAAFSRMRERCRNAVRMLLGEGPGHLPQAVGAARSMPSGGMVGILGVYGKGNLGDEALLLCIADDVRSCVPDAQILAICSDPDAVRRNLGFTAIERSPADNFISKLRLVRSCRLLIIGGGSLLCDHRNFIADVKAIVAYLFWPTVAGLFGVPTIAYAQGLGPAAHGVVRQAIRWILPRMADVTFRDSASARLARGIVGDARRWRTACDPVVGGSRFMPEEVAKAASARVQAWLVEAGDYALVALRHAKRDVIQGHRQYLERSILAIAAFQARSGAHLILFPTHISEVYQDDRVCLSYVKETLLAAGADHTKISVTDWHDLVDGAAILQNARVVVGDRLHALLLAAMNGVPIIGFTVEDKIGACLSEIGMQTACQVASPEREAPEIVASRIFEAWSVGPAERTEQYAAVARWRARHLENVTRLQLILSHGARGPTCAYGTAQGDDDSAREACRHLPPVRDQQGLS